MQFCSKDAAEVAIKILKNERLPTSNTIIRQVTPLFD